MMRPGAFECVDVASNNGALPLRSAQWSSQSSSFVRLAGLALLAAVIVMPQLALAVYALASPEIRAAILTQPVAAFQFAAALLFWLALFGWPLKALYQRLTWHRDVEITSEQVAVRDSRTFGGGAWSAPLASYSGVTHHVRASLSGTRHELILVHPDSTKSVLLLVAEHITDAEVQRMARLVGHPTVPAGDLYRLRKKRESATNDRQLLPVAA